MELMPPLNNWNSTNSPIKGEKLSTSSLWRTCRARSPNCSTQKKSKDTLTALKKAWDQNEPPKVYEFQSQGSKVYSELITSLPVKGIQHRFTKQPYEIHFGGSDIQHYFNPIYEYTETTEEHASPLQI